MKDDTHDDEPLTFTQFGLPAALLINRMRNDIAMSELVKLDEQTNEPGHRNPKPGSDDEKQILKDLSELNRRLAALRRWRGIDKNRV